MTAPCIELETLDFVEASRALWLRGAEPVEMATRELWSTLGECAGMAGSDPGGSSWAASYDRAATAAVNAAADAVHGVTTLARMFAQTARNYDAADAASTASVRRTVDASVGALPCIADFALPSCTPASALGVPGGGPPGWSLVESAVGYVWPNGHQDRLHRAAGAWRRSSAALADAAQHVIDAPLRAIGHRLPESDDMWTVCSATCEHLRQLSDVHAALGDACAELAQHIDELHSEVIGELRSLLEWSAAIQAAGGLLSIFTLGVAEAPTQAAEAARISRTALTVASCIEKFMGTARGLACGVEALAERAGVVSSRLRFVIGGRLVEPALAGVGPMRVLNEAKEVQAAARLGGSANAAVQAEMSGEFLPPRVFLNRHGQLTNGRYTVSDRAMAPHTRGSQAGIKSQFFSNVDAEKAVLDAAAYADRHALWVNGKAKVFVRNGFVGVWSKTGEPTRWINVYRSASGAVHGSPGGPP